MNHKGNRGTRVARDQLSAQAAIFRKHRQVGDGQEIRGSWKLNPNPTFASVTTRNSDWSPSGFEPGTCVIVPRVTIGPSRSFSHFLNIQNHPNK